MSSSYLSRYVYYVYFIDEFSRKTSIHFMKNKDEVFSKLKEFKSLIKNHTKKRIKTFRSDNGGEFTSNEFKGLCKDSGIKRELSTPYNLLSLQESPLGCSSRMLGNLNYF